MEVKIRTTKTRYDIRKITDFGVLHNVFEFIEEEYTGVAIFKAEVDTIDGIRTVIGIANKGDLTGEWCDGISVTGIQPEEDIKAIVSLRNTLFKDFDTREVYLIGRKLMQPARFGKKMTFEKAIEALVNDSYNRVMGKINESKMSEAISEHKLPVINTEPVYNLGDRFALITMGFVCAPIKIIKRLAITDYDTGEVNFMYNLKTDFPSGKPEPLNWDNVEESRLQEWARASAYDIKNTNRYADTKKIAYRYSDLVNMKEDDSNE